MEVEAEEEEEGAVWWSWWWWCEWCLKCGSFGLYATSAWAREAAQHIATQFSQIAASHSRLICDD